MSISNVRVKFDNRKPVMAEMRSSALDGLEEFAEFCLDESNQIIPIEEGTLERSGIVEMDRNKGVAQISYDTPYARRQHEDTTLSHDEGRQAKFLESTLNRHGPKLGEFIATRVRRATGS